MRLVDLEPMLLSQTRRPFDDDAFFFEFKYDGFRALVAVDGDSVAIKTRRGADATSWFPELAHGLRELPGGPHILDGEICVLDAQGRSDFMRLQARASRRGWREGADPVVFCAFDLLMLNGKDCRERPLVERKKALSQLLAGKPASILFVDGLVGQGTAFYAHAVQWMLEGVVAKRLANSYHSGEPRTGDWLKIKRPGAVPPERFRR